MEVTFCKIYSTYEYFNFYVMLFMASMLNLLQIAINKYDHFMCFIYNLMCCPLYNVLPKVVIKI